MPETPKKLYLNLYWHMHQPDYRDLTTGEYVLPWTYLHAIKDYSDMVYHLEENPKAKVSFNFVPILVEQLLDYANQFANGKVNDPLLAILIEPDLNNISVEQCKLIIQSCFKANHEKMLHPFPPYQRLLNIYQQIDTLNDIFDVHYLSAQYKEDLITWYHLAWTGESLRKNSQVIQRLMNKGVMFDLEDRLQLFGEIKKTIAELIPRYIALSQTGQIEISTTPYYHPILPLLIDLKSTKDVMPCAPLPKNPLYPGGAERAKAHIESAKHYHEKIFGQTPIGMWPAEGGVSHAALSQMAEHGLKWAATGQGVLANSLIKSDMDADHKGTYLYKPYKVTNGSEDILCFFRDDLLSDKIGFEYSKIHASSAVADFMESLESIHQTNPDKCNVVSVILDGENAWEYYPYNGYYFLKELYEALVNHPNIEMTTFNDIVQLHEKGTIPKAPILPQISAGSWVYGTFSTWIGSADKNKAWDLLCEAKKVYDQNLHLLNEEETIACEKQLAICEGSDWYWWFGEYNASESVKSFDKLYRRNLINLYQLLKQPVPAILHMPISVGGGDSENAGTMRRGQES